MNLDNFLLTPEEATNLVNDLFQQPQACTPWVCAGVLAVALYVAVVWSWTVFINIAVAVIAICPVIGPCQ
jgi:uncharacterized membrane protein YgaE (UPF0421/DUF939 family)